MTLIYGDGWLIACYLTPLSTVFQLYRGGQCTCPCFPGVLFTSTLHNILSKPLAASPHDHCRNNGQPWERNESCRNNYHKSSERILAEPGIEPATCCSELRDTTDWAMGSVYKGMDGLYRVTTAPDKTLLSFENNTYFPEFCTKRIL